MLTAVAQVLADRGEPMRAKDVHVAVERLLGEPIVWSSVKQALASNASGISPRFVRVRARGPEVATDSAAEGLPATSAEVVGWSDQDRWTLPGSFPTRLDP